MKATDRSERDLINRATTVFSRAAATDFKAAMNDRAAAAPDFKAAETIQTNSATTDFKTIGTTEVRAAMKNFNRGTTGFNPEIISFNREMINFNRAGVLLRRDAVDSSLGNASLSRRESYRICK